MYVFSALGFRVRDNLSVRLQAEISFPCAHGDSLLTPEDAAAFTGAGATCLLEMLSQHPNLGRPWRPASQGEKGLRERGRLCLPTTVRILSSAPRVTLCLLRPSRCTDPDDQLSEGTSLPSCSPRNCCPPSCGPPDQPHQEDVGRSGKQREQEPKQIHRLLHKPPDHVPVTKLVAGWPLLRGRTYVPFVSFFFFMG